MPAHSDRSELIAQLGASPFFKGLDAGALAELAGAALRHDYAAGEVVFLEGERSPGLYYLQSGWLKIVKSSAEGREQVLQFLGPGETFNALGALADRPNPATAIALEPAGVWLLGRAAVARLLRERPDMAPQVIANMADRLAHLVALVEDLALRSVTGRLARMLLDGATDDVLLRPKWYTQAELAARLGTVPDVIQRALSSLVLDGLIEVERQRIVIRDRPALERLAG